MLQTNLQMYQTLAQKARLGELQPETNDRLLVHLVDLQIEHECAVDLGDENRAEFAERALQILARGLADLHSVPAGRLHDFAEEVAEEEIGHRTRAEKINDLQETGEARLNIAFNQPIQN